MGFVRRLFGRTPSLSELARGKDREAFLAALRSSSVIVLGALTHPGLPADDFTKEDLLAMTEAGAKHLSESKSFHLFYLDREGVSLFPFFSDAAHAEVFVGEYSKARNRIFPFQTLQLPATDLFFPYQDLSLPVLNPSSSDEYLFTEADRTLLAL